jgi:hypothetical protein
VRRVPGGRLLAAAGPVGEVQNAPIRALTLPRDIGGTRPVHMSGVTEIPVS